MSHHIHQALDHIKELKEHIIENQRFRGYSGAARIFCGFLALLTAWVLSTPFYPQTPQAHVVGWGTLCALSVAINYGALLFWFFRNGSEQRDYRRLRPLIDAFPPLLVGGILTFALLRFGFYDLLFGVWMCLFGLTNIASRHVLPKEIWHVGWFYILSGTLYLLFLSQISFLNPWPMGIVFFVGELGGGLLLYKTRSHSNEKEDPYV